MTYKRIYDLEERLISFAVAIIDLVEELPNKRAANHLAGQIVRSGTAPALIYGEAQSAESRKDFIHKMKLCLKELRETLIALKIIQRKGYIVKEELIRGTLKENNELVSIFVKSIETAVRKEQTS